MSNRISLPDSFPFLILDEYVIMPNHIHVLIRIQRETESSSGKEAFGKPVSGSIPTIVQTYKAKVSNKAGGLMQGKGVWQRNYYEHVVRTEAELNRIRRYIVENPLRWGEDQLYML